MISSDYIKLLIYCNNELDKGQFGGKVIHVFLNIYNYVWKTQVERHDEEGMHHLHPN